MYYNPNDFNNQYRQPVQNNNNYYYQQQQAVLYYKQKRAKEKSSLIRAGFLLGGAILAMLLSETFIIMSLQRTEYYSLYTSSSLFQSCINMLAVHLTSMLIPFGLVALIRRKTFVGPLVPTEPIGKAKTFAWLSLGMGICMVANILVSLVIKLFEAVGYKLTQPESLKPDSVAACVMTVISVAIVPAVFEEFAFRCCALSLFKPYGKAFAVVAVSIVFGLCHGNIIQFCFTFIIGLLLGYVTVQTNSIIPAMLIHGFNNGLSAMQDVLKYTSGSTVSDKAIDIVFYGWIFLAIGSAIYLFVTKSFKPIIDKRAKEPFALSFGAKLACLIPGLFLPFIILMYETSQYISKV